jgi:2-phosphoglycerate kinase
MIRDLSSDGVRPLDKYLERIGDIRYLQDFIVERAQLEGVPVIENSEREKAIGGVLELVLAAADETHKVRA